MSDQNFNPQTHRLIQTNDGVVTIPREQKGVPLNEYFKNAEMPQDLNRAVVYATEKGPVLSKPDAVPWNEQHNEKARQYAENITQMIDEKGYYSKALGSYAQRLAEETGQSREEMKAVIVKAFEADHGQDPFSYLREQRERKGLPVRENKTQYQTPDYE